MIDISWRHLKHNQGATIVEMLVASMIFGVIGLIGMRAMIRPVEVISGHQKKLMGTELVQDSLQTLLDELEHSYVFRSGIINCEGGARIGWKQDGLIKIDGSGTPHEFQLEDFNAFFSLAYARYTEIAGLVNSPDKFRVNNVEKFPEGSLVVLSQMDDPEFAGLFVIANRDANAGTIGLAPAPAFPSELHCSLSTNAKSLNSIVTSNNHLIFNQKPRAFYLYNVGISTYQVDKMLVNDNQRKNLLKWEWHRGTAAEKRVVVEDFVRLGYSERWFPAYMAADFNYRYGSYQGVVQLTYQVAQTDKSRPKTDKFTTSYDKRRSVRDNIAAPSFPTAKKLEQASCAIIVGEVAARKSNFPEIVNNYYLVSGLFDINVANPGISSSGRVLSPIVISLSNIPPTLPPSKIGCWSLGNPTEIVTPDNDPNDPPVPYLTIKSNQGTLSAVKLPAICEIPDAEVKISGIMNYFDDIAGRMNKIPCSPTKLNNLIPYDGREYFTQGATPAVTCKSDGTITIAKLFADAALTTPGLILFLNEQSCKWSGDTDFKKCSKNFHVINNQVLEKVRTRPTNIKINGVANDNVEIDCTP